MPIEESFLGWYGEKEKIQEKALITWISWRNGRLVALEMLSKTWDCSLILITPTQVQLSQTLGTENEYVVFLCSPWHTGILSHHPSLLWYGTDLWQSSACSLLGTLLSRELDLPSETSYWQRNWLWHPLCLPSVLRYAQLPSHTARVPSVTD